MKILVLLEKISTGAQAIRLKQVIKGMNHKLWDEFLRSKESYVSGDEEPGMGDFKKWCIENKKDYIESVLLQFGQEFSTTLKSVKIMQDGDSSYYDDHEKLISMHTNEDMPVFDDRYENISDIEHFLEVFIHELYHSVQFANNAAHFRKQASISNDKKYWFDKSDKVATYDHHSVTPLEIEAMANDSFAKAFHRNYDYNNVEQIHRDFPTWADFMANMRENSIDPESIIKTGNMMQLFRRLDRTSFDMNHPLEGKMMKMFIKEYLKVAQNFYYGGIEDDTGKFRKQRELGKQRKIDKKRSIISKEQNAIASELEAHMKGKVEKNYTLEDFRKVTDWYTYVKKFILVEVEHDLSKIKEKIKNGESINGWIHQHIPSDVISVTGLNSVDIEIKPFDFDDMKFGSEDFSFKNGKLSGKFHTSASIDEFGVSDLLDVMAEICSNAVYFKSDDLKNFNQ